MYFHKLNFFQNQTRTNQAFVVHIIHHIIIIAFVQ